MTELKTDADINGLRELVVLEQVTKSPRLNNRKVSHILGVSMALAHYTLKRMVKKGLLHITKHHARRWDYFLTPAGMAEKARLTTEFLDVTMDFYHRARRQSAQLCKDLARNGQRRVALLGATELAEIVYIAIREWDLMLTEVYDAAPMETFLQRPVRPVSALDEDANDAIIVCLYDPADPMGEHYLPREVAARENLRWVFDAAIARAAEGRLPNK